MASNTVRQHLHRSDGETRSVRGDDCAVRLQRLTGILSRRDGGAMVTDRATCHCAKNCMMPDEMPSDPADCSTL